MNKYAKLVDGVIEFAPVNFGPILNFNKDENLMQQNGYKKFVEVERPDTFQKYEITYTETKKTITEKINYIETVEEAQSRIENEQTQKQQEIIKKQIAEIDQKRIRAICEPSIKDAETGETWLEFYNNQIAELRSQL